MHSFNLLKVSKAFNISNIAKNNNFHISFNFFPQHFLDNQTKRKAYMVKEKNYLFPCPESRVLHS